MKKLGLISFKSIVAILSIPTSLWLYIDYSRQKISSSGSTYKPYPLNRGLIHHIVYLDSPILDKPLNLNNYWLWAIIVIVLLVIITTLNILVNIVSLSNENVSNESIL